MVTVIQRVLSTLIGISERFSKRKMLSHIQFGSKKEVIVFGFKNRRIFLTVQGI